jgi:hypothetical protein
MMVVKNNHLYPCLKPDISEVIDEISLTLPLMTNYCKDVQILSFIFLMQNWTLSRRD